MPDREVDAAARARSIQRFLQLTFVAAIVFTVVGALTGSEWVIVLGIIASLALFVVNGVLSSRARQGAEYSSRGSLFDD